MMKKVLSLIFGVTLAVSSVIPSYGAVDKTFTSVGASGVHINEDFTKPQAELNNDAWAPQGWTLQGVTGGEIERINPEGYVELQQNFGLASAQIQYLITKNIPQNYTLMFDVYFGEDTGRYVYLPFVINGYNVGFNALGQAAYVNESGANTNYNTGTPEFDTWYTYIFQVRGDHRSIYRKAESETEFVKVADNIKMQTSTAANTLRIYALQSGVRTRSEARLDNVKIVSGTYLLDSEIEMNADKTQITGSMKIGNADTPVGTTRPLTVIMSAYDSRGKILKITMENRPISFGEGNEITVTMPVDTALYEKLKGGTVELYIWDSASGAKPQCDMHVLEVQ